MTDTPTPVSKDVLVPWNWKWRIVRSFLFRLDAEDATHLSIWAIRIFGPVLAALDWLAAPYNKWVTRRLRYHTAMRDKYRNRRLRLSATNTDKEG